MESLGDRRFVTQRKLKVYTEAGSKKVKFTVPVDKKVKLKKMIYKNKKYYIEVTYGSKKGWIMSPTRMLRKDYFKDLQFAG